MLRLLTHFNRFLLASWLAVVIVMGIVAPASADTTSEEWSQATTQIGLLHVPASSLVVRLEQWTESLTTPTMWQFYSPVVAAIRQLEEAPGQVVYQSRQSLKDQHSDRWQLIVFKRVRPNGQTSMALRIVGFPGVAVIDRTRPLMLTPTLGRSLTAPDTSRDAFSEDSLSQPHIGQYDIHDALAQLQTAIPVRLILPTVNSPDRVIPIAPTLIQEWKAIADRR